MDQIEAKMDRVLGPSFQATLGKALVGAPSLLEGVIGKNDSGFKPLSLGGSIGILPAVQSLPNTSAIRSMIVQAARSHNVDPALFDALIQTESDYNPLCRSSAGAMGLSQLMPETAKSVGVSDPFDPMQSLNGGAAYLRQMLDHFGNVEAALAAYNAGPGAVEKAGGAVPAYPETQNYVKKIMSLYGGAHP
jgi:soluble lytic murein transglycosylase-like protein